MNIDKKCIIMNSFFYSQFDYCPLVWMLHSRSINNKINPLHGRAYALYLVTLSHPLETFWKNMGLS